MIIFDASTMILLAKIDILELFVSSFNGEILMPEEVRREVCVEGREETPLIIKLIETGKIDVLKVKNRTALKKFTGDFNIDRGEAEALALAMQEKADLIATDDRNAIRACKMLNIDFVTAVAILVRAHEKYLIDRDETLIKLKKLHSVGRYSRAIIESAEKQIKGDD